MGGQTTPASVSQLGYLVFEVSDLDAWATFATDILGLGMTRKDDTLTLRMDKRAARILVTQGPADDLAGMGWQVADQAAMDQVSAQLTAAGCTVTPGSADDAKARQVTAFARFKDPAGVPGELFYGARDGATGFVSKRVPGGYVAGELGMGHCAITAPDKATSFAFYRDVLGLRHSDDITCEIWGHPVDMAFLRANARHHSVAFGGPQPKHLHHFLIEARSMDAVGAAFDRTLKARLKVLHALGRHPNDRMFSFYALTPSGFAFEFGYGGVTVDDEAAWKPTVHDRISDWGHQPPGLIR